MCGSSEAKGSRCGSTVRLQLVAADSNPATPLLHALPPTRHSTEKCLLLLLLPAMPCRDHLISLGCEVRFGTRVEDVTIQGGRVTGVKLAGEHGIA